MLGIKRHLFKTQKAGITYMDYDATWEKILAVKPSATNAIPSAFIDWDNTPRKIDRGSVYIGANPESFKHYFRRLVEKTRDEYLQDKLFVFAWNEWTEGGYLEPDERFGYGYLEAIRTVLSEEKEFEYTLVDFNE